MKCKFFIRLIVVCLILAVSGGTVRAQESMNKDSLLQLLPRFARDTGRVLLYIQIGQQYESNLPDSAKYYYRQAGELSRELGWDIGVIKYISNYTFVLNVQGKFDSSLLLNRQSLDIAKRINSNDKMAVSYNNIAAVFEHMRQFDSAIYYYQACQRTSAAAGKIDYEIIMENNLSALYNSLEQFPSALEHSRKAVALARNFDNVRIRTDALVNIGAVFLSLHRPDSAVVYLTEAIRNSRKENSIYQLEQALLNYGDAQLQLGDYDGLLKSATESLQLSRDIGNQDGEITSLFNLAYYYLHAGDKARAGELARQALAMTRELKDKESESLGLSVLSDISLASGDFAAYRKYRWESDSVHNVYLGEKTLNRIDDLRVKYETEKKENQLKLKQAELGKKNVLNYILLGSAAALLLIIILSYRSYNSRRKLQQQKIRELEQEKQLLSTEAVLKGEEQERSRLARDLHDGLGGMLSGIKYSLQNMKGNQVMTPENQLAFGRSLDMLDSSIREMRRVAHNLMPEALLKFGLVTALRDYCEDVNQGGSLRVSFQPIGMEQTEIETNLSLTVYRVVQELVNNILKHAGARTAIVQLSRSGERLSVTVEDDGKGFDPETLAQTRGIGWSNIRNRVEYLKGTVDVQSAAGKGSSVHIEIPL